MAEEMGLHVDVAGFETCMEEQRERSRAAGRGGAGVALRFEAEETAHLKDSGAPRTDDTHKCDRYLLLSDISHGPHFVIADIQANVPCQTSNCPCMS